MIGREFHFHDGKKGGALAIRVVDGAKETLISRILPDGTVVVHLKGHPQDSNAELVRVLSRDLGIDSNRIDIIAGETGEDKLLSVLDIEPGALQEMVLKIIS